MWISEGLQDLNFCMKEIMKGLRELKKSLPLAFEMLKVFSKGHDSSSVSLFLLSLYLIPARRIILTRTSVLVWQQDFWNHKELAQVDCSENGEVLSIVFFKDKIFSGHSDGIIKVTFPNSWSGTFLLIHFYMEMDIHFCLRLYKKNIRSLWHSRLNIVHVYVIDMGTTCITVFMHTWHITVA